MIKVSLESICTSSANIRWKNTDPNIEFQYIDLTSVSRELRKIDDTQSINAQNAPSRAQRIVYENDVIFATTRPTLRRVCMIPSEYDGQICSTGFCVLRPDTLKLVPKYLFYMLLVDEFYNYLEPLQTGATYPAVSDNDVRKYKIPLPSISEQQRIVDILDTEFAKIDALKENAEKNLQNAKDLFQAVLRKELEPKEGWETVSIGDIAELKGGKRVPKGYKLEKTPTPYPYIRVADFNNNGSVDLDDIHYISEEVYNGIKRYIITTNDVYISIAGTIGKSGIIPKELNGANLTENACRLVFKEDINPKYVYYCTLNPDFKEQIAKLTMQAAQPKLALTRLATAVCNIPPRKDQDKIVDIISTVQNNITILCNNYIETLTLCDDLKQALLRKAFNGEL